MAATARHRAVINHGGAGAAPTLGPEDPVPLYHRARHNCRLLRLPGPAGYPETCKQQVGHAHAHGPAAGKAWPAVAARMQRTIGEAPGHTCAAQARVTD